MRSLVLAAFGILTSLTACDVQKAEPAVKVEDARVQLPVIPGRPGALYFTATSSEDQTKLISITSPKAEKVELHETKTVNGVARMSMVESHVFSKDRKLVFAPGSNHAMLFGLDPALKAGDRVALTFSFEPAKEPVTVEAEVRTVGGESHEGH